MKKCRDVGIMIKNPKDDPITASKKEAIITFTTKPFFILIGKAGSINLIS
jgi:hypothetical protein